MLCAQSGGVHAPAGGGFIATISKGAENGRKSEQHMLTYLAVGWDFVGALSNGTEDVWEMSSGRPMYPKPAWEQMRGGDVILTGVQE